MSAASADEEGDGAKGCPRIDGKTQRRPVRSAVHAAGLRCRCLPRVKLAESAASAARVLPGAHAPHVIQKHRPHQFGGYPTVQPCHLRGHLADAEAAKL